MAEPRLAGLHGNQTPNTLAEARQIKPAQAGLCAPFPHMRQKHLLPLENNIAAGAVATFLAKKLEKRHNGVGGCCGGEYKT